MIAKLSDGSVSLSTLRLLGPHMQPNNYDGLLAAASRKSKREVQELVAALAPRPDTPESIRKLPEPAAPPPASIALTAAPPRSSAPSAPLPPPTHRQSITPLSPGRYEICFTAGSSTKDKLKQVQDLVRHALPSGDYGEIFDRALTLLLKDLERKKCGSTDRPRPGGGTKRGPR